MKYLPSIFVALSDHYNLTYVVYDFSNNNLKPANVMLCKELNEQIKVDDDEWEEYDEETIGPNQLKEELKDLEDWERPT